ncbi:MAG: asparagine synthase (glutamine-hydrolyzing) [Solirubrobacteraceae bacterium]
MCGIAGYAGPDAGAALTGVTEVLRHRGPDAAATWADDSGTVALTATRLAIQDIAHGRQPMENETGTVRVVFNGEIYNAPELRERLVEHGHRFASVHSDTEVLVHLYEELGEAMLDELNGMFAFVVHDGRNGTLFGARDRLGIKPLYIARPRGGLAFASELKGLLLLPGIDRELDPDALSHYLSLRFVPGTRSMLAAITRLPPGHCFRYDLATHDLRQRAWWRLDFTPRFDGDPDDLPQLLREQLRAATARWTLSDVPIACALSGGVDSAAVVGLMRETGYGRLSTYTLGFDDPDWNELPAARAVARRCETDHHELVLRPAALLDDLLAMVWALDEPYGGGLPSWYVFKELGAAAKVAMTGTGGDELFGSYGHFAPFEWSARQHIRAVPGLTRRPLAAIRSLRAARREPVRKLYFERAYYLDDATKRASVLAGPDPAETATLLEELWRSADAGNPRDAVAAVEITTQLPDEFLLMTDRFSMSHSVEARVPLLDHELVEFVAGIPAAARTSAHDLKGLLKAAVADLLPPELAAAPKRGFVIPLGDWLRGELGPLALELLSKERLAHQGIFRPEVHDEYVRAHVEGRRDHGELVWTLLMFQLWHVLFIEERLTAAPTFGWRELLA